jgi:hypothetical protein
MIDENAFGLWLGYHSIEDDEYAAETRRVRDPARHVPRRRGGLARGEPLGTRVQVVDLGHGLYVEIAEGDEERDLLAWLRGWRGAVETAGFVTTAVLSHGGRWVAEEGTRPNCRAVECARGGVVYRLAHSSEALRRALYADTATQQTPRERGGDPGSTSTSRRWRRWESGSGTSRPRCTWPERFSTASAPDLRALVHGGPDGTGASSAFTNGAGHAAAPGRGPRGPAPESPRLRASPPRGTTPP